MEVIVIETNAFNELINRVVDQLTKHERMKEQWISQEEAMKLMGIKSKTTMQQIRDNDDIVYAQPSKKVIVYDRESIYAWFEKNCNRKYVKRF